MALANSAMAAAPIWEAAGAAHPEAAARVRVHPVVAAVWVALEEPAV